MDINPPTPFSKPFIILPFPITRSDRLLKMKEKEEIVRWNVTGGEENVYFFSFNKRE